MRKKLISKLSAVFVVAALLVVFTGCQDKDYYNPDGSDPTGTDQPSTIDFSTTKSVELYFNYQVSPGYVSTFDIFSEYPLDKDGVLREDLKPITGGINIAGVSQIKRIIPAFVTDLYVYSTDLFIPRLKHATIDNVNGVAVFEGVEIEGTNQIVPETRAIGDKKIDKYLKSKSDYYLKNEYGWINWNYTLIESKYDLKKPDMKKVIPAEVLKSISQAFPEGVKAKDEYFQDALIEVKSDPKLTGVQMFVSVLHAGGDYNNSLSYFVYEGPKDLEDLTVSERNALEMINVFQFADVYNNSYEDKKMGLTPGHYVQIKYKKDGQYINEFPVGAKVGWVLHSKGFNEGKFNVNESAQRIYSISSWNANNAKKTVFFGATDNKGEKYSCFGFEDEFPNGDNDCNDVLFHVYVDPIEAVNPPPFIPEYGTIEKKASHKGILAFEDNWPGKGDYDLNDVVVKYNSTITYVQDGETTEESGGELVGKGEVTVKRIEDVFSIINSGAEYENGFSYKVDINPSSIKEIQITDNKNSTVNYVLKNDGDGFIIDICESVKGIRPEVSVENPAIYIVKMEFNDKVVPETGFENLQAPYNPYIRPKNPNIESDGIEVHLPFYNPTDKADMELFFTGVDVSDVDKKIFYASKVDVYYPFALHLSGISEFVIPVEKKPIDYTYPKYINWVNNQCGLIDADWYLHPVINP